MILINPIATALAAAVSGSVYYVMQRRSLEARWGDVRSGVLMLAARNAVYNLANSPRDERSWQPNLMVLSGAPTSRWYLIQLANALSQQKGFLTVAAIVGKDTKPERMVDLEKTIRDYLEKQEVASLVRVHSGETVLSGAQDLIRTYGFGPLVPNTIMVGETEDAKNFIEYSELILFLCRTKRNLIVVREGKAQPTFNPTPRIDIWWRGWTNYAAFKLAIVFLITKSPEWARARVVLKNIVKSEDQKDELIRMQEFINDTRLEADAEVIVNSGGNIYDTIRKSSEGANLVFMGLRPPAEEETAEEYSKYYEDMLEHTHGMPPVIQTLNAEDVEFQRIFK
ncbi:hypothetical protein BVY04_01075 [bacterium M21]|nr:hypothetical protein BVY04_01075 [bacterium M21]